MLHSALHIIEDKTVSYTIMPIQGQWEYFNHNIKVTENIAFEYRRYCNQLFEYVGCSLDQATQIKQSWTNKLVRDYYNSVFDPDIAEFKDEFQGNRLMGDVSMHQIKGSMYKVTVSIREEDILTRLSPILNASVLFSYCNDREYATYD